MKDNERLSAAPLPRKYFDLLDRAEKRFVPISALVELSHACNLKCEHCYLDLVADKKIGALSTGEWKRIFGELAEAGCLFLTLSGGELLLRRDWFELASHARALGFALRLYTNGVLIDDEAADRIASLSPLAVEVSLHGATAATQDAITQKPGSFDKTLRGARLLRARGVPVLFKCVIMRKNHAEYALIRELAASIGADVSFDAEVTPMNNGSLATSALAADEDDLAEIARDIWADKTGCAHGDRVGLDARLDDAPCSAGRRTCHIGPTGDLHPCTQWTKPVGSLRSHSFRELWQGSPVLADIRAKRLRDLTGCTGCEVMAACNPCMALSLLEHGDLAGPSDTKCRASAARATAMGISGAPNARKAAATTTSLVQLRRRPARATARTTG